MLLYFRTSMYFPVFQTTNATFENIAISCKVTLILQFSSGECRCKPRCYQPEFEEEAPVSLTQLSNLVALVSKILLELL